MPLRLDVATLELMAVEHVLYEVERLTLWSILALPPAAFNVRAVPADTDAETLSDVVRQATLESALLHLRNIVDFVISPRPTNKNHETDLVADDYFDDGWANRPSYLLGSSAAEHKALMVELHRRLAHLTTHRLTGTQPGSGFSWRQVIGNVPHVVASFRQFVADLDSAHPDRARWFATTSAMLDARFPLDQG